MDETLAQNAEALEAHLEMLGHAKGTSMNMLTFTLPPHTNTSPVL
jgi:hypothetical protein